MDAREYDSLRAERTRLWNEEELDGPAIEAILGPVAPHLGQDLACGDFVLHESPTQPILPGSRTWIATLDGGTEVSYVESVKGGNYLLAYHDGRCVADRDNLSPEEVGRVLSGLAG